MRALPSKEGLRRLGLVCRRDKTGGREFFRGVCAALRERGGWRVVIPLDGPWFEMRHLKTESIDGFIGPVESRQEANAVAKLGIPHIFVHTPNSFGGRRAIDHDNKKVARLAAEHLISRSFEHFATLGFERDPCWKILAEMFAAVVREHGGKCHAMTDLTLDHTAKNALTGWLEKLPRPCGVFCANDGIAAWLINRFHELRWAMPSQMGVMSVGRDIFLNLAMGQTISSVILDESGMGRRAVECLDRTDADHFAPIPPLGIYEGASTGLVAPNDQRLLRALELINQNPHHPFDVKELARVAGMGRRGLEKAFAREIGRSPHQEMMRVRMEAAKTLLLNGNQSIDRLAEQCGFSYSHHFINTFRKHFGLTPLQMRKRRLSSAP